MAFRVFTQLPQDDCLYSCKTRYYTWHVLLRIAAYSVMGAKLPREKTEKGKKVQIISHRHFCVDIAEVQTEEDRLHFFTATDRTSKFAYARSTRVQHATVSFLLNLAHTTNVDFTMIRHSIEVMGFYLPLSSASYERGKKLFGVLNGEQAFHGRAESVLGGIFFRRSR